MAKIRSYTSSERQTAGMLCEFLHLYRGMRRAVGQMRTEAEQVVAEARRAEQLLVDHYGIKDHGLDVLEIGVGQLPRQTAYFAHHHQVTGIDLDVIPQGLQPLAYYRLLRSNGPKRLLKTAGRKLLGMDRAFNREIARVLDVDSLPRARLLTMDAAAMSFADESFDLVYSFNVFEHLPDPGAVLDEMKRVLRPGGCALTHLHLYTSDSGCHDVRILSRSRGDLPYWPHLRPTHAKAVQSAAYVNEYRISKWRQLFGQHQPGSQFEFWQDDDTDEKQQEIQKLRAMGELELYTDEELLTVNLLALWRKPAGSEPA